MSRPKSSHKLTPEHLARKAVVYLRQSSLRQVRENLESQRLQYALAEEARELGFREVEIVDTDLGSSASVGAAQRLGFDRLVGSVARGEVGMVLGRELSRLLRTDKDFCRLIEVCQSFDTLIADEGQIYEPEIHRRPVDSGDQGDAERGRAQDDPDTHVGGPAAQGTAG